MEQTTIDWAQRVLTSRNDKPLSTTIEELVGSTGAIGDTVLDAVPDFGSVVAGARTGVSHGGAKKHLDTAERYWYGEVLRWIVRARLLMEIDDIGDEITRPRSGAGSFPPRA